MLMNPENLRRYTVGVLVSNEPGVLSRVSGLFSRRGFNIESLAVGPTQDSEVSRITIVVLGDDAHIEQLVQQLYKLICVQKVQVLSNRNDVERQLLLVKVAAGEGQRAGIRDICEVYKASIVDFSPTSVVCELTGKPSKINGFLAVLAEYKILELCRTGVTAMDHGEEVMTCEDNISHRS